MIRAVAAFTLVALSAVALAQQPPANPPVRIRGTVEKLDGNLLTVKARNGQSMTVKMADNFGVVGIQKASIADIGTGKYVGATTVGEKDGVLVAEEVHIFLESQRGVSEGHFDWDLKPNSKMTNANVASIVGMQDARVMTVQYKGGEKKILVTPQTVVVQYGPADKSEIKPGAPIFTTAQRQPDGSLAAARINVGLKGQVPPM